jgi:hypothetical protein
MAGARASPCARTEQARYALRVPSFDSDIRPMFRDSDVQTMLFAFDLSKYDDVRANADAIYERVADGSMPCDTAWSAEQIARFQQWMQEGFAR